MAKTKLKRRSKPKNFFVSTLGIILEVTFFIIIILFGIVYYFWQRKIKKESDVVQLRKPNQQKLIQYFDQKPQINQVISNIKYNDNVPKDSFDINKYSKNIQYLPHFDKIIKSNENPNMFELSLLNADKIKSNYDDTKLCENQVILKYQKSNKNEKSVTPQEIIWFLMIVGIDGSNTFDKTKMDLFMKYKSSFMKKPINNNIINEFLIFSDNSVIRFLYVENTLLFQTFPYTEIELNWMENENQNDWKLLFNQIDAEFTPVVDNQELRIRFKNVPNNTSTTRRNIKNIEDIRIIGYEDQTGNDFQTFINDCKDLFPHLKIVQQFDDIAGKDKEYQVVFGPS